MTGTKFAVSVLIACHLLPITAIEYTSVYVPIGVGQSQLDRNLSKPFGYFHTIFTKCGQHSVPDLNEAYSSQLKGSNVEVFIDCEPSPSRVITSATEQDFGDFSRDFKKECELFVCSQQDYTGGTKEEIENGELENTTKATAITGNLQNPDMHVCKLKKPIYPAAQSKDRTLFANEGNCFNKDDTLKQKLKAIESEITQVPRWLKADEDVFNLRSFYFKGEKSENMERVPYIFGHPTPPPSVQYQKCETACDRGTVVKMTMNKGSYKSMVFVNPKACSSFRICFAPDGFEDDAVLPKCLPDYTIDVLFKNGVVIWGKKGRASVIEFMSEHRENAFLVPIEFGYGARRGNTIDGEFYIGNDHREVVTSDTEGYSEDLAIKLAFFFPVEDCLATTAGIFSKYIQYGKTFSTSKIEVVGNVYNQKGEAVTGPVAEVATTTTKKAVFNFTHTTTPAPLRVAADPGAMSQISESAELSAATFVSGKWWTWGIYIGFIIGTLLTLGIGGGVFYLLRRTVFGIWYRGMYKRYGCDPSGTTGGLTGVGFGNTTTGTVTVGGTTGGDVTASLMSGVTGTTGGDNTTSSTSVDKTSTGQSTIAM